MYQSDEFFDQFAKWVIFRYLLIFSNEIYEKDFLNFIKESFSRKNYEFLFATFKRFKAAESEDAKKKLCGALTKEFNHAVPEQVKIFSYQTLKEILLSIFEDKDGKNSNGEIIKKSNTLGMDFVFNAAITDFPGFDQCCADENLRELLFTQEERGGFTPLHHAVFNGSVNVIKCYVNKINSDVLQQLLEIKDKDSQTAFELATQSNVSVILAFKKATESLQEFVQNLLRGAIRSGNIELINFVLDNCSNINAPNSQFPTAIGEVIHQIEEKLRQKKWYMSAEVKQELDEEIKYLANLIRYFLGKGIDPTNAEQNFIKYYVDKGILPLKGKKIREIVNNYKKTSIQKSFLSLFMLFGFWLGGKGAQSIGGAADAGYVSITGLVLITIALFVVISTFNLVLAPRDKILFWLAAVQTFFHGLKQGVRRLYFGPDFSSEEHDLTEKEQKELFYPPEEQQEIKLERRNTNSRVVDSTLAIKQTLDFRHGLEANCQLMTLEEEKKNTVVIGFSTKRKESSQKSFEQVKKYPESDSDSDLDPESQPLFVP